MWQYEYIRCSIINVLCTYDINMVSLYKLGQWVMQKGEVGSACASEGLDLFVLLYIYKLVVNIIKRIILNYIILITHDFIFGSLYIFELKSCLQFTILFPKMNVLQILSLYKLEECRHTMHAIQNILQYNFSLFLFLRSKENLFLLIEIQN